MPRPGPLQDLPLEQFPLLNPNTPSSVRPNKRPLDSPGTPILYSPAKRRILTDEGIFSPEKTIKSPLSHPSQESFVRFTQVLHGTESPARRLAFGTSSQSQSSGGQSSMEQVTPRRSARLSKKLASPPPSNSSQTTAQRSRKSRSSRGAAQHQVDPLSIHYPGFFVHLDGQSDDDASTYDMEVDDWEEIDEKELTKENVAPKRRVKKLTNTTESTSKADLPTILETKKGDIDKSSRIRNSPSTPKRIFGMDRLSGASPRRSILRESIMHTPRTRADMRRQLTLEVDAMAIYA